MNVSNAYLQNRVSRGVPYTNQGLNQKRVVVGNENYGYDTLLHLNHHSLHSLSTFEVIHAVEEDSYEPIVLQAP